MVSIIGGRGSLATGQNYTPGVRPALLWAQRGVHRSGRPQPSPASYSKEGIHAEMVVDEGVRSPVSSCRMFRGPIALIGIGEKGLCQLFELLG